MRRESDWPCPQAPALGKVTGLPAQRPQAQMWHVIKTLLCPPFPASHPLRASEQLSRWQTPLLRRGQEAVRVKYEHC